MGCRTPPGNAADGNGLSGRFASAFRSGLAHDETRTFWGRRAMRHASNMLMVLLYAQGLLGFAGMASVILKDWTHSEPAFVHRVASADAR